MQRPAHEDETMMTTERRTTPTRTADSDVRWWQWLASLAPANAREQPIPQPREVRR
jgi:hypothetical protein